MQVEFCKIWASRQNLACKKAKTISGNFTFQVTHDCSLPFDIHQSYFIIYLVSRLSYSEHTHYMYLDMELMEFRKETYDGSFPFCS